MLIGYNEDLLGKSSRVRWRRSVRNLQPRLLLTLVEQQVLADLATAQSHMGRKHSKLT
jgi:hypothetical protein